MNLRYARKISKICLSFAYENICRLGYGNFVALDISAGWGVEILLLMKVSADWDKYIMSLMKVYAGWDEDTMSIMNVYDDWAGNCVVYEFSVS